MPRDRSNLISGAGVLVTTVVALLGVIGVTAHVISYSAAHTFYAYFGLEPIVASITPVNAAFSLHNTWFIVYLRLVSDSAGIVYLIALFFFGRTFWSWLSSPPRLQEPSFKGQTDASRSKKYGVAVAKLQRLRRELRLAAFEIVARFRGIFAAVVALLLAAQIFGAFVSLNSFYLEINQAARERADAVVREGRADPFQESVELPLVADLSPPVATVRWSGRPERLPVAMMPTQHFYIGRFMGIFNGQYVIYLYDTGEVVYLSPLDVSVSTFVLGS